MTARGPKEKNPTTVRSSTGSLTVVLAVVTCLCVSAALAANPESAASPSLPPGILDVTFNTVVPLDPSPANSWISSSGGKWETAGDWSAGVPSAAQSAIVITNGLTMPSSTKTVVIDQTTVTTAPTSMTINNLIIGGRGLFTSGIINGLILSNTQLTALDVLGSVLVSNRSSIFVTNSVLNVSGAFRLEGGMTLEDGI